MAGRQMLQRFLRLYFGGYDLSGDSRTVGEFDNSCGEVDMTAISDTVANYLAERRMVGIRGYQAFLNDAAGGASAVLNSPQQNIVVSAFFGNGAAPAVGDLAYILPSVQLSNNTEFSASAGLFSSDFVPSAATVSTNYKNPWGVVLMPLTAIDGSGGSPTYGTAVDLGASSTLGGHASLHVSATDGNTWFLRITQSATGAFTGEQTQLVGFNSDGSVVGGDWTSFSGSVARYLRAEFIPDTVGTLTAVMAVSRN